MTDEQTYTLAEAERELKRRQCALNGHYWSVISEGLGRPVAVVCDTCGISGKVTLD